MSGGNTDIEQVNTFACDEEYMAKIAFRGMVEFRGDLLKDKPEPYRVWLWR